MWMFLKIVAVYVVLTAYCGFWNGIRSIRLPGAKGAFGFILFNTAIMPIALPVGIWVGLRNMIQGGQIVVFHIVDIEHDGTMRETKRGEFLFHPR